MDEPDLGDYLIDLGAGAGGAATGLVFAALGDPTMAALAAGATGTTLATVGRVARFAWRNRAQRAADTVEIAADRRSVTPDQLALEITADEQILEIALQLVEAASATTLVDKQRAIAGVLASLPDADAIAVDIAAEYARAWRVLDRPHLVLLRLIADEPEGPPGSVGSGWSSMQLRERSKSEAFAFIVPWLSDLDQRGAIRNVALGTWEDLEGSGRWIVTDFGAALLSQVETPPQA